MGFGAAQREAVQQLEVKHVGPSSADAIQFKILTRVLEYQVLKNSEADEPKTFQNPGGFELLYGVLPPQGSFRLVFKTSGAGIAAKDLQIRSDKVLRARKPFYVTESKWAQIRGLALEQFGRDSSRTADQDIPARDGSGRSYDGLPLALHRRAVLDYKRAGWISHNKR